MNNQYASLGICEKAIECVERAELALADTFKRIDNIEQLNTSRVLSAFIDEGIAPRHFAPTTGYGYDDAGRDSLDRVFARALFAEDALVRPQLVSGTHAIYTAVAGLASSGSTILSATGTPYDTMENAISNGPASLAGNGVRFESVELDGHGKININRVLKQLRELKPELIYVQRSRGYAWRDSLSPEGDMAALFSAVKAQRPECTIFVDNCYGEFTSDHEPTLAGADIIAGSLIKNPGGGLAPTGGYIAGKKALVERIAMRLTVPGMGREVGSYAGSYRPFYQGLFMAPHVTAQALRSAALYARVFLSLGYDVMPAPDAARSDIVQAIRFDTAEKLISFCKSVQASSPVDSFASPEPWDMPGYASKVIMAAGTFVQGASIELSADAPIREPYTAYVQGALTYAHGKLSLMKVVSDLMRG